MRQITVQDIEKNPESFMISATWCGPCNSYKKQFKSSNFPYINYDQILQDGEFVNLERGEPNLEVQHLVNTLSIPLAGFPTFYEYTNGKWSRFTPKLVSDLKDFLYKDLVEEAQIEE
jgi:thiol-disulfide isomerase/thioredoxin